MGRIEPIQGEPQDELVARVLRRCEATGTPDERMIRVFGRSEIGAKFIEFCSTVFTEGLLPHRLKELVRIRMSVVEECGYCSSIRSKLAMEDGLTESVVLELTDLEASTRISAREETAIRYADLYKRNEVDSDAVFEELRRHFTDEEIIELGVLCSILHGGGPFTVSLQVLSWEQACEVQPSLLALQEPVDAAV
jgi:AhpD family alkylhydroperoxidase